jgi:LuxR family maltose regulon positive regulatory protein
MPEALIHTKLHPPFTRQVLVARPQLKKRIQLGVRGPLTLIAAPAGFGKTTLAASYAAESEVPLAWLSLDKDDNQIERFLKYLVAALQAVDPTIGCEAAVLLSAVGRPPVEAIMTSIINDLDANAGEIALVLNDYQFISSQAVHERVAFLLDHCPATFHLVIVTRSDPPLPLARLRARGQVVEIRAADLRFTETEAAQFLNDVIGLGLDAESVAALDVRTEGWIAGLQMAAITLRDRRDIPGFIAGFTGSNRFILDYLMEEVLARQPQTIQHFLLYTSILNRLTAPLCDFILAIDDIPEPDEEGWSDSQFASKNPSASVLEFLERANLFLVPLDDERIWYRYHHLFADMLRARLHQAQPDILPLLHIQAAAWLEEEGLLPEAIQHLFAANEHSQAAGLMERYGPAFLIQRDPSVLNMADSLQQEILLTRPKLALYLTWLLIVQGRIPRALQLLNGLAKQLAGTGSDSGQRWMQTIVLSALAFLAPQSGKSALDLLPDYRLLDEIPPDEPVLRNAADFLLGMALGRRGKLDDALKVSLESVRREKNSNRMQPIPTLAPLLTRLYLIQGRLHEAASLCRQFLDPFQERDFRFVNTAGSMKIDLGEVLYEWNHLEEAERHIREGLQANEPWQNIMTDGFGLAALTRVLQAKGDYAGAMQVVDRFESRLQEQSQPREFFEDLHTLRVRVQLASGDLENPTQWASQVVMREDFKRYGELYRLTLGQIWLAQGRFANVEQLLAGTTPSIAASSQTSRQLESNLLLAAAIAGQGRQHEALSLFELSLATAEPEGYIRIFLNLGQPVRDLFAAYLRSGAPDHEQFARTIMDAFSHLPQVTTVNSRTDFLVESLTERELEVLQLISLGRTNKEIAGQLYIAPGTVKAHTASIYRKLDVANRTEAVAHARQLGILP